MKTYLFATKVGEMAVSWNEKGICRVYLPGTKKLKGEMVATPPLHIKKFLKKLFSKKNNDLLPLLDFSQCSEFQRRVYLAAAKVPAGMTCSYGELAKAMGSPKAARAVGTALGKNPWPVIIPCHRIIGSNSLGGFSAPRGLTTKQDLLALEA